MDTKNESTNYPCGNLLTSHAVDLPQRYKPRRQDLRLAAQRNQFSPHVSALTVGSTIGVQNADSVAHHIELSGAETDQSELDKLGDQFSIDARMPGIVRVQCSDHEWMEAFIRIDPHPFHAVTDSEGSFAIEGVPVGNYKLAIWHERFGEQQTDALVRSGETTRLEIHYPIRM